jgi:hypothetical protein
LTIEDLYYSPGQYLDTFVEIYGINEGTIGRPDCSPWVGPPTQWYLYSELHVYHDNVMTNNPLRIEVQNNFDGAIGLQSDACGNTLKNPLEKKVALRGWVRLYNGPVDCVGYHENGTPVPLESKQVWYIEAMELQFLENIDVTPPPGRPDCIPSAGRPTKTIPPVQP